MLDAFTDDTSQSPRISVCLLGGKAVSHLLEEWSCVYCEIPVYKDSSASSRFGCKPAMNTGGSTTLVVDWDVTNEADAESTSHFCSQLLTTVQYFTAVL